jgi:hypothetical protein
LYNQVKIPDDSPPFDIQIMLGASTEAFRFIHGSTAP